MAVIVFDAVSKGYSGKTVLHDFSLSVEHGERVSILGPSGCGKTTVLRLLSGFIAPDTGTISIDGETVAANGKILEQPERRHLGMVFQDLAHDREAGPFMRDEADDGSSRHHRQDGSCRPRG